MVEDVRHLRGFHPGRARRFAHSLRRHLLPRHARVHDARSHPPRRSPHSVLELLRDHAAAVLPHRHPVVRLLRDHDPGPCFRFCSNEHCDLGRHRAFFGTRRENSVWHYGLRLLSQPRPSPSFVEDSRVRRARRAFVALPRDRRPDERCASVRLGQTHRQTQDCLAREPQQNLGRLSRRHSERHGARYGIVVGHSVHAARVRGPVLYHLYSRFLWWAGDERHQARYRHQGFWRGDRRTRRYPRPHGLVVLRRPDLLPPGSLLLCPVGAGFAPRRDLPARLLRRNVLRGSASRKQNYPLVKTSGSAETGSDLWPKNPRAANNSALSSAAPAAPRTRLCDSSVSFTSSSGHSRTRPTTAAMPFPVFASLRGCGRSSSSSTTTGFLTAVGNAASSSDTRKSPSASRTSSIVAVFFNRTDTHSVCPSTTGTRLQCALIPSPALMNRFPSHFPSSFCGSASSFSSSPLMNGITFPSASIDGTPG